MEYGTIIGDTLFDLIKDVNKQIKEGWEPLGGVAVWNPCPVSQTGVRFIQAMVLQDQLNFKNRSLPRRRT